jgi:hypothetical protein
MVRPSAERRARQAVYDRIFDEMAHAFYTSPPTKGVVVWPTLAQALHFGLCWGLRLNAEQEKKPEEK